jgi:hypothetical protein
MMEIVRFTKSGGPLTKRIYLTEDGTLKSDGSACLMSRGIAERVEINDIAHFGTLIGALASDQAIALGALRHGLPGKVTVATKAKLNGHTGPDIIARTASNIVYRPGPGLALVDFDTKGMPPEVKARLEKLGGGGGALLSILPTLRAIARVSRLSTSAGIYRTDSGAKFAGSNGAHVYLSVKDSADIDRFVRTLHDRCWLAGFGWMMVGAGGQLLDRSIVDRMVGAPERLVFEGAPVLDPPLGQDQEERRPHVADGGVLDTVSACPPLSVLEKARLAELKAKEAHRLTGEAAKARTAFVDQQADKIVRRTGMSRQAAMDAVAKQCMGTLLPTIELPFDDAELAGKTVADVLAEPERFEGETLADPQEGIDYGRCKAKIMLNADGTPWIHSFAHGRTVYELKLDAAAVRAAMDGAAKDEVLSTFVRLVMQASLGAAELEDLIAHAKELTGRGMRAIARTLKQAKEERAKEQAQAERNRRAAERNDPRPEIAAPPMDAPWLPQMTLLDDVLGSQKNLEPPMRNIDGMLTESRMRAPATMHAFGPQAANGEDATEADNRLPAPAQHLLTALTEMEAAELIERHIDFIDAQERSVHLAAPFVRHYMQRAGGALPVVSAIATLPLVLANGVVLAEPGLDRSSGILFKIEPGILALMPNRENCGKEAVAAAMRFLTNEWLVDVATNDDGKCILLAAALTIIERSLIPERPTFFVSAGRRGGGKTTTLSMLTMAILGSRPAAAAWSPNDEERRKSLLAYLMDGLPYILWDNIHRGTKISCPHIERSCTTQTYADRKLGVSQQVQASAATVQLFTGNNIGPKGELASRSLQLRLDVDRVDPENRDFKHPDVIDWTEANRAKILQALYTILMGNPQLSRPRNAPAKTRFKVWWRLIGSAIEHAAQCAGKAVDFHQLFIAQEADDEDSSELADVLAVLNKRWQTGTFKAADVATAINEHESDSPILREFLFPGGKSDQIVTTKAVGKRLCSHVDNPVLHHAETLTLRVVKDAHTKTNAFYVKVS